MSEKLLVPDIGEFEKVEVIELLNLTEVVKILDYSPNSIDLEVNAEKNRLLFLSDAFFPGWEAIINGKETEIYRSNYAFRSIVVKPGKNAVRFEYNPTSFQIGRIISFFSLIFFLFIILKGYRIKNPSLSNQSIFVCLNPTFQ